ncbi:unnamed protein product [Gongylonema pulchrum]|uniref:C2H2-type domain-containing protein n=1 Tax=Gongylonema pulchrum TaxID=637853 RepID=A0A183E9L8_9BILA|nr:unnamed protein product [Gongylonema pulchrum]
MSCLSDRIIARVAAGSIMELGEVFEKLLGGPDAPDVESGEVAATGQRLTWVSRLPGNSIHCHCLWMSCGATFAKLEELGQHFLEHCAAAASVGCPSDAKLLCPVLHCEKVLDSTAHMLRHVYAHVFHMMRQYDGLRTILSTKELLHMPRLAHL